MSKIYPAFRRTSCDVLGKVRKWFRAGGWVNWKNWITIRYFMKPLNPSDGFIMNISKNTVLKSSCGVLYNAYHIGHHIQTRKAWLQQMLCGPCGSDGMFLPYLIIISIPIIKCCWLNIFYWCRRVKTIHIETEALFIECLICRSIFPMPWKF